MGGWGWNGQSFLELGLSTFSLGGGGGGASFTETVDNLVFQLSW